MFLEKIFKSIQWRIGKCYLALRRMVGIQNTQWLRIVMDEQTEKHVRALNFKNFDVLEISGDKWKNFGFKSYQNTSYPEYDLCSQPLAHGQFDMVVVEQVLEHVPWPRQAVRNVWEMLRGGGIFLLTTPFLIRIHLCGQDYSRWTEKGLKNLLIEGGFEPDQIQTGSWGNRACVKANFDDWTPRIPWLDSLTNEPEFPLSVWAFARKGSPISLTIPS